MYNPNNRQYVFKQSSGKVYNFFYDEQQGLCYSTLTKQRTWTDPLSLQKNMQHYFCMDMDVEDRFHILHQDKQGNIHYTKMDAAGTGTVPVLNSKQASPYNKYLFLIPAGNTTHFFYMLVHNNQTFLSHQTFSDGKAEVPKIVDYVVDNACPYVVVQDKTGSIYAFYQSSDGQNIQLGYKKYLPQQKQWGEFNAITKHKGVAEYPRAIVDTKGTIHLCYQWRNEGQNDLVYLQKVPDKNMWTNESIINSGSYSMFNSSVVCTTKEIIVYWVRDNDIYCSTSGDYGVSWTRPAKFPFSSGRQLICIFYKTNSPFEIERIIPSCMPGNFTNGFKLAFYQTAEEASSKNMSSEDLRKMIVDSLQLLRVSIEELKEENAALKESISGLLAAQQNVDRELTKCTLRLGKLESELGTRDLQELRRDVAALKQEMYSIQKKDK